MLVLASQSPRRRALLEAVGRSFVIRIPAVDETPAPDELPVNYALRVASAKAAAVEGARILLAADTVVALNSEIFGKATDHAHAEDMLARLSARTHGVHTAVVVRARGRTWSELVTTEVRMRRLSSLEIKRYVATDEPMDKAGAYAIQGLGGALVAEIRGSYTNVVGLPLEETLRLLDFADDPENN